MLKKSGILLSVVFLSAQLAIIPTARAAPKGGNIVGGSGSIGQSGLSTSINQNSSSLAIDWTSYNLDKNEIVDYLQPNSSAIALNRILGGASQIHGKINANGKIVLVNPNGLFFGKDASVNVGGLIASGLDIDPVEFMNGNYVFRAVDGSSGTVTNAGVLNASLGGSVTLLGKQIRNEGLITANLGSVNLAAGKEAVLTFDQQGLVGVRVTKEVLQDELGVDPAIVNSGDIKAAGGRILLTASQSRDLFSSAVNTDGIEQATSVVVREDGSFILGGGADVVNTGEINVSSSVGNLNAGQIIVLGENITNSGQIHADSLTSNAGNIEIHSRNTTQITGQGLVSTRAEEQGRGGKIKLLGKNVGLFDQSQVDASGANGGGEILIGGDERGKNSRIRNAEFIYLGEESSVNADALGLGDGGKVITFAEDTARIYGELSASGGADGGNGGFVETSGLSGFQILYAPNVTGPNGSGGEWLIDPYNIQIVGGGGNTNISNSSPFISTSEGAQLGVNLIESALSTNGVTVTISTGGSVNPVDPTMNVGAELGDIFFFTNLDFDVGGGNTITSTLILEAHNEINLNNISISGGGGTDDTLNLELKANNDGLGAGNVVITNSEIDINGGSFTASGVDFTSSRGNGGGDTGNTISTTGGNITLTMTGAIDIGAEIITEGGDFTVVSATTFTNDKVNGDIDTTGTQGGASNGDVSITNTGTTTLGLLNTKGNLILSSGGNITDGTFENVDTAGTTTITAGANNVTLDGTSNNFGGAVSIVSANNVVLAEPGTINMGTSTVGGTLTITADSNGNGTGVIIQSGAIAVTGLTTLTSIGTDVTLDNAGNNFSTVAVSALNVVIEDVNSIGFGTSSITGALDATANGAGVIFQTGVVSVTGDATFDAAGNNITLANADNNFSNISVNGANVSLQDAGNIELGASTVTGTLGVVANGGGDITQNGALAVTGTTTLGAAGDNITLGNTANNFSSVTITSANNATLNDADSIVLNASTITGDLNVTAENAGTITQAGTLAVTGDANFTATGNNITLADATNNFSTVSLNGANVILQDAGSIDFGASAITGTLDATANGTGVITQTGAVSVTGIATIIAAGNDITLNDATNDFSTVFLTGANVTIDDASGINFGNTTATGALTVDTNSAGTITQTGALTVTGNTTLTATGNDITLADVTNTFSTVSLNGANVILQDANSIDFGASTITGTLNTTANGLGVITQSGAVSVTGIATFDAAGNDITLANAANDFSNISVNGANVSLQDAGDIQLGSSTATGTFDVVANGTGAITQTGALTVTGNTTMTATGNDITLADATNTISTISLNGANVVIQDADSINFGASTITGTLDATANGAGVITQTGAVSVTGDAAFAAVGNDITLANAANNFSNVIVNGANVSLQDAGDIQLGSSAVTGTFDVVANGIGDITQNGALVVTGTTTLAAAGDDITLGNAANNFSSVAITLANIVSLTDTDSVVLNAATIGDTLDVSAVSGSIAQSGALAVTNGASFTAGSNITLADASNTFSTVSLNGINVAIQDADSLDFGASAITGTLDATANGAGVVTQSGAVSVTGIATIIAAGNDITLNDATNDFSNISANGANVSLQDAGDIQLGSATVTGTLGVIANGIGDITQNGALVVTGTTTLAAAGDDITLGNAANNFSSVAITSANIVSLTDTDSVVLNAATIDDTLDVSAVSGSIAQSGALAVTNDASFTAGSNITLADASNTFSTVRLNGINVAIQDADSIDFGASAIAGTLDATANGAGTITQSGVVSVTGAATFDATGNDITLDDAANDFSTVTLTGANVTIDDVNNINFGTSTATGTLSVDTNGAGTITQTGALTVTGNTTLTATGSDITLVDNANNFSSVSVVNAQNVSINDADGVDITASTIAGDLNLAVIGAGNITQSGALAVNGNASFTVNGGQSITLNEPTNSFQGSLNFASNTVSDLQNVTVANNGGLNLGAIAVSEHLSVTTNGAITNSGALIIGGVAGFDAGGNAVTLSNSANDFNDVVLVNAASASITGTNGLNFGSTAAGSSFSNTNSSIAGGLTVDLSSGNFTDQNSTGLIVAGVTNLDVSGDIILDSANNNFSTVNIINAQNVTLADSNAISLQSTSIAGDLSVAANGNIDDASALSVNGNSSFSAVTNGDITLDDASNTLAGTISFAANTGSLANVTLVNTIDTNLAALTVTNNLTINSGGSLTQSGGFTVADDTTLTTSGQDITLDQANNLDQITIVSASNALINNDTNNLKLNSLDVDNVLTLNAASIIDNNGSSTNVQSNFLKITSANGIGSDDALDIAVNTLDAVNTSSGKVELSQEGDIDLVGLKNLGSNGDITFISDGDINFNPDSTVASLGTGDLFMQTSSGSFLGLGTANIDKPDITAQNAIFDAQAGTFGSFDRPLTLNIPGTVFIRTRGSFDPQFVPPGPSSVTSTGVNFTVLGTVSAAAGEQLVEVESLSEVDPAIFTALSNYSGEEISIRLPRDQLYEDDLEGDEATQ